MDHFSLSQHQGSVFIFHYFPKALSSCRRGLIHMNSISSKQQAQPQLSCFRLKIYCNLKTKRYLHSPCVCLFFREVLVERSFAGETTAYTQGEEPIICLNMSLRIVVVITNRAVITGITVSLTSIPWQWFGSL